MKHLFFLISLFVLSFQAVAGIEKSVSVITVTDTGNVVEVTDNKYSFIDDNINTWRSRFEHKSVRPYVMLKVDQYSLTPQAAYSATVEVNVTTRFPTSASTFRTLTMQVDYNPSGNYKDKHFFLITSATSDMLQVRAEITSICINQGCTGAVPSNLRLEAGIEVERLYSAYFNPVSRSFNTAAWRNQPLAVSHKEEVTNASGLEVSWNYQQGAESYELEWVYLEAFDFNKQDKTYQVLGSDLVFITQDDFLKNATRVETVNNHYEIPLIYDQGYLVYRVRPKIIVEGRAYTGVWSFDESGRQLSSIDNYFHITEELAHETYKNWQTSVQYAEEGKNKIVSGYFDGSTRSRQVVTRINTDEQVIAAETIYDQKGRPVIQVLPAPVPDSAKVHYYPYLNLSHQHSSAQNLVPYHYSDFDFDAGQCETATGEMSTINGASRYYSPENEHTEGEQAYLPDAARLPFTQTEYMPDNTGRVKSQTLPGSAHTLGSGHEKTYHYTSPAQEELDELFGFEAGYNGFYNKNIVKDENGQYSFQILDNQDRVIASAMKGDNPDNLEPLASRENIGARSVNFLNGNRINKNKRVGNALELSDDFIVLESSPRTFDYRVTGENFVQTCEEEPAGNACYNCIFDLEITLKDACGNTVPLSPGLERVIETIGDINAPSCTVIPQEEVENLTTNNLPPGDYTITKKLSINYEALERYTREYLENSACVKTESDFLLDFLDSTNIAENCVVSCDECEQQLLANQQNYFGEGCDPCLTEQQFNHLLNECRIPCDTSSSDQCEAALQGMLLDVSPFGQYGQVFDMEDDALTFDPSAFPLSLYNASNVLPRKQDWPDGAFPDWQHPYNPDLTGEERFLYLNGDSSVALILLDSVTTGLSWIYIPRITDDEEIIIVDGKKYINPKFLVDARDFVEHWKPSYARSLLIYHPEYSYLQYCQQNSSSHDYDHLLARSITFNDAVSKGLVSNTARPDPVVDPAGDPWFQSLLLSGDSFDLYAHQRMRRDMAVFAVNPESGTSFSLWEMAYSNAFCPQANLPDPLCAFSQCPAEDAAIDFRNYGDNAELWNSFKMLYYSLKNTIYRSRQTRHAIVNASYNDCIGDSLFNPLSNWFLQTNRDGDIMSLANLDFISSQYTNVEQPCNIFYNSLYAGKVKRFQGAGMIDFSKDDELECSAIADSLASPDFFTPYSCKPSATALNDLIHERLDFKYYQECGLCPVARDLELFLHGIAAHPQYTFSTGSFGLTCPPEHLTGFTPLLASSMGMQGTEEVRWENISSSPGQAVSRIQQQNGAQCTISLAFTGPHNGFLLDSANHICCINVTSDPQIFPLDQGKNFTVMAAIPNNEPIGSAGKRTEEFTLEGLVSCLVMDTCVPPVQCKTTPNVRGLAVLLDMLALTITNPVSPKPFHLTSDNVNLSVAPYLQMIPADFREQGPAGSWTWSSDISGNRLEGVISGSGGQDALVELLIPDGASFTFSQIDRLVGVQPDPAASDREHSFIVKARVNEGGSARMVTLRGFTSFRLARCVQAVVSNP